MHKLLVIDVDALFDQELQLIGNSGSLSILDYTHPENSYWKILPLVFDKIIRTDWYISLWTSRPRNQVCSLIRILKDSDLWDRLQFICGTSLLLNISDIPRDENFSPIKAKLDIFERIYKKEIKGKTMPFAAVESNYDDGHMLEGYLGKSTFVHVSPKIWMELLVADAVILDKVLFRKNDSSLEKTESIP